nr:hypothetical protein BdHM001_34760 [Bdellovibrio sp. HM001]
MNFKKFDPSKFSKFDLAIVLAVLGIVVAILSLNPEKMLHQSQEWGPAVGKFREMRAAEMEPQTRPSFREFAMDAPSIPVEPNVNQAPREEIGFKAALAALPEFQKIVTNPRFSKDRELAEMLAVMSAETSRQFARPDVSKAEAVNLADKSQTVTACADTLFGMDGLELLHAQRKAVVDTAARKYYSLNTSKHLAFGRFERKKVDRAFCKTYLGAR